MSRWSSGFRRHLGLVAAGLTGFALHGSLLWGGSLEEARLDARLRLLYRAQTEQGAERARALDRFDRLGGPGRRAAPRRALLNLLVKYVGETARLEGAGLKIASRLGEICTGTLAEERLAGLAALPGVRSVESSRELRAAGERPDRSAPRPSVGAPPGPRGGGWETDDASGSGVVVAFVDTGVDIRHEDFRKADGTTRIKYLLDFSTPGDVDGDGDLDGPGPFGGTLFTEAQINATLQGAGTVTEKDTTGHGTHGLSVAAGDDPAAPGLAPAAELIVVKATREPGSLSFTSTDVVNALAFVDQKAGELGRPYVVNLSLGTLVSAHDGRSLEEQAIDGLLGPGRPGKVAVIAAGNSSQNRSTRYHHLGGVAYTGLTRTHTLTVPSYTPNPGRGDDRAFLDVWYQGRDKLTLSVTSPSGDTTTATFGAYVDRETAEGNVFIANLGGPNLENGDIEAFVLIDDWAGVVPAPGAWTISFRGEQIGDTGEYHAWLSDEAAVGSTQPYLSAGADNRYLVGKPGSALHGITVGSYAKHLPAGRFRTVWTDVNGLVRIDVTAVCDLGSPPNPAQSCDGDLSDFSSPGPTRDGRVKPELVAPGERALGAVSRDADPCRVESSIYRFHPFPECDGLIVSDATGLGFGLVQGTSFSAPVVTGLAARILSTNPSLDAIQVRNVLINGALHDAFTGPPPSDGWGYGKVALGIGGPPLPGNLRITTDTLPGGVRDEDYSFALGASGGRPPYAWSLASGALPSGLSLDSRGLLSGRPSATGTFGFTVAVADAATPAPQTTTKPFTLAVVGNGPLEVLTAALPPARLDKEYDEEIEAVGGVPPYTWSLAGGTLPPGLTLTPGGRVQGIATVLGRYDFTVQVADAASGSALRSLRMRVSRDLADLWDPLGIILTSVNHVVVDPRDTRHLFASTENVFDKSQHQVYESGDGGDSWKAISINNGYHSSFINNTAKWLAVSPTTSKAWAITENSPERVLRYENATEAWVDTNPCSFPSLDAVAFDSGGVAYLAGNVCGGNGTFLRSADQGASWQTLGTLCGGAITDFGHRGSLSMSPSSPNVMYATRAGSLGMQSASVTCRSGDGGLTWQQSGATLVNDEYFDVQVSATDPLDVVRAVEVFPTVFVEKSSDGGQSWSPRIAAASSFFRRMVRSPSNPAVLLIGALGGLRKSVNGGQSWTTVTVKGFTSLDVTSLAFDPTDADRFYVGSTRGLFFTSDGGLGWSLKNRGLETRGLTRIAISQQRPDELMLGTTAGDVYLSRTGGERWTRTSVGIVNNTIAEWPVISAADPDLYLLVANPISGLMRSDNKGLTWRSIRPPVTFGGSSRAVDADPFNPETFLTEIVGGEIHRTVDGGTTWTRVLQEGFAVAGEISYARDVPGRVFAALGYPGLLRSDDGGVNWAVSFAVSPTNVTSVEPAPSDSRRVYAAVGSTVYWRDPCDYPCPAEASHWHPATVGPGRPVLSLAVDWGNPLVAYAGSDHPGTVGGTGGLYKTVNGGANWLRMAGLLDRFDVTSVVTHPTSPGTVYAATREGGVYRSRDGGVSFTALDKFGSIAEVVNVTLKHPEPGNPALFAGTEGYGVQVSTNGGQSFVSRVNGLGNLNVNSLAFEPGSATVMYAGTDGGIYKSVDTGNTWAATGLTTGEVRDLITDLQGVIKRIWGTVSGQGVAYSADAGATFTVFTSGLASLELTSLELEIVGSIRRIWGTTLGGDGVVYSDDLGQTWKSAAGAGLTDHDVTDLLIQHGVIKRIWGTTNTGVFYSDDDGLSWTEQSLGLPGGVPVTSVSIDPNTGEALVSLFSDREGGVFRAGNTNGIWSPFNDGLDELKVQRLTNDGGRVINPTTSATTFYAATAGDGAYANEVRTGSGSPPTITTSSLAAGVLRLPYVQDLAATGGTPPYVWSVPEGLLPAGLLLDAGTGRIRGDPGQAGTFSFTVQVADAAARAGRKAFVIVVNDPRPTLTGFAPVSGPPGTSVTISGKRFTGATAVSFNGLGAAFTVVSDAQISTTVPLGAASGPLRVTTPAGTASSALSFSVTAAPPGLDFYTLTPCRLVDTRTTASPLAAGEERTFVLVGSCALPVEARAVSVNVAVTQPTAAGNLRLYPADAAVPLVSSVNYSAGQTRGNNGIVSLSPSGELKVKCAQGSGTVHLILDVNGYFR